MSYIGYEGESKALRQFMAINCIVAAHTLYPIKKNVKKKTPLQRSSILQ